MSARFLAAVIALWCGVAEAKSRGQLLIITDPPGAIISVDGTAIGAAPAVARDLLAGDHLVEAAWPDGRMLAMTQSVEAGGSRLVKLTAPATAPPPPAPAPPPPAPAPPPPAPAPAPPPPAPAPAAPPPSPAPAIAPADPYAHPEQLPSKPAPPVDESDEKPDLAVKKVPSAPPPPLKATPERFYKSALFWTGIALGAAIVIGIGVGAGLAAEHRDRYALVDFR